MEFNNIYNDFKINVLKVVNSKINNNYVLSEDVRNRLIAYINRTEDDYINTTYELDKKLKKLDTAIYIENDSIEESMKTNKEKYKAQLDKLEEDRNKEIDRVINDLNDSINKINQAKKDYVAEINNEINNINQAIKYELLAYEFNDKYYTNLINKALVRYDNYNSTIFNKIVNIDINQPKTPKFNAKRKKISRIINYFKNAKNSKFITNNVSYGNLFLQIMNEYSSPLDDIITNIEEHSEFQTRIDNLNIYIEKLNKEFNDDKNKIEKIKHEVSVEYNKKLSTANNNYNHEITQAKGNNERKIKSIDKRIEKQKKDYQDESARISEDYVSHITNISNEINNLDKENKRLIDNYNREYYFTYYKTLFEYNNLVSSIKDKTLYSNDQRNKNEQKRLDNFEIKAYQQKLKSLKLKHDKYVEQLNLNIIQQINHNNYEITESNLYKAFDLTTSKIKHESFMKKSKLLKDNIEKTSSYSYAITRLNHEREITNLRFKECDKKRQELDYEIEKLEIEHIARRTMIEKKILKYTRLKDEYLKFVECDDQLIKTINDSEHNTKLTTYYFEIKKNNILKEYNKNILELAKSRANIIKEYKINYYNLKIQQLKQNLEYYLDVLDYRLKYYTDKYNYKYNYTNHIYDIKRKIIKNNYNNKKNLKAIVFERNTFRQDNLKSSHYSDYVFNIYSTTNFLHVTLVSLLSDYDILKNNINKLFINFYFNIVTNYYKNEQNNLEHRLNEIYYYKNSLSIKNLHNEKDIIKSTFDKKINNIKLVNDKYKANLEVFNNKDEDILINTRHINRVKKELIKDIKNNEDEIAKLEKIKNDKLNDIDNIILKNKRSSIIHYQNYHKFKKTMSKLYNNVVKNINQIEHKAKNKNILLVLEEHRTYIVGLKLTVFKTFKRFTTNVENEFPKENSRNLHNYNQLNKDYEEDLVRSFNVYNINVNKLNYDLNKNSKTPAIKSKIASKAYIRNLRNLELHHDKTLLQFKHRIKKLQKKLITDELNVSNLISNMLATNRRIIKETNDKQQERTTKYIETINTIRIDYMKEITAADRNRISDLYELKNKYNELSTTLKASNNSDVSKTNKEIRLNQYNQKELQRIYKKNSSNIDADLINDRVDQQILLSQKLKKLKRLFISNKDLSSLADNDYTFVSLDSNNKNE